MDKWWSPEVAAQRVGVSRGTIINWIRKRRVRAIRIRTRWKVDPASVTLAVAERADRVRSGEGEGSLHALAIARFRAGANVSDFVGEFQLPIPVAQALFDMVAGAGRIVMTEADQRRLESLGYVGIKTGAALVALVERLRAALREHRALRLASSSGR